MNSSKIVFIVNEAARLIRCSYEPMSADMSSAQTAGVMAKQYSFKTLDPTIQKDDLVIVETNTRHGFTVVKVEEVDLDVDFDDSIELKWAFHPLNLDAFKNMKAAEQAAIDKVRQIELRKKRDALRKAMFDENEEAMQSLALAKPDITPGE